MIAVFLKMLAKAILSGEDHIVEMANDEDANRAIASLNETELDGRAIVVKPANPKAPAEGGQSWHKNQIS